MKKIIFFVFCSLLLIISATGCGRKKETHAEAVTVRTMKPVQRVFQDAITTQGVIEPVHQAVLSTLIPGKLELLTVKEGDAVKKGQLLFRSDRQTLENRRTLAREMLKMAKERVHTREADVKLSKVTFEKAETDFNRNKELYKAHAVSQDKYESFELVYRKARLSIEQAEASLSTARAEVSFAEATLTIAEKRLADSIMSAPYDGVITAKLRNENEFCHAGTPVLKIEQPDAKRIAAVISGIHYPKLQTGKSKMEVSFSGKVLCTVPVTIVGRAIDTLSRTFEVKGDLPRDFTLPSGTLCSIRIIVSERRSLALPEDAVLFRNDSSFVVFEELNGKSHEVRVQPGITQNGFMEILDQKTVKGRNIIVSGQYFVNDGSLVRTEK